MKIEEKYKFVYITCTYIISNPYGYNFYFFVN